MLWPMESVSPNDKYECDKCHAYDITTRLRKVEGIVDEFRWLCKRCIKQLMPKV